MDLKCLDPQSAVLHKPVCEVMDPTSEISKITWLLNVLVTLGYNIS